MNITLIAANGIGSPGNFVEIDLDDTVDGVAQDGVLNADANLEHLYRGDRRRPACRPRDLAHRRRHLVARAGSILDANDDLDEGGNTLTDADGRVRDASNVVAINIDLDANGVGSSIGDTMPTTSISTPV